MAYVLTEEQQFLKDSAKDLLKGAPVALVRELRDSNNENGYSVDLWKQMVEMGWPGLAISEELGGLDFGIRGIGILMEESGRTLSASPLLSVAISTKLIEKYGSDVQKEGLADMCENGTIIALALQEGNFYNSAKANMTGESTGQGFILNGTKDLVADGHNSEKLIVSATIDGKLSTFLIDSNTKGITIDKEFMMDSRFYSSITFDNVNIPESTILGGLDKGKKVCADATDLASALLSAELLGVMSEALERTVAYLKERRQFGKLIGTFQALQHRAADLYGEIELAKSLVYKALDSLDNNDFMAPAFCSMAKVKCSNISKLATNEGVQMFGGIGMTDDEEIGFYMKRARVATQLFGGTSYHLNRFAKMNAY